MMNIRTMTNIIFIVLIVYGLTLPPFLRAQAQGIWVEGVGKVELAGDLTPDQARHRARILAENNAIEKAFGIHISSELFLQQFEASREDADIVEVGDSFSKFVRETRFGRIINQGEWKYDKNVLGEGVASIIQITARNHFQVIEEKSKTDPDFNLRIEIERNQYRAGDAVSFQVTSTKDCYLTVFDVAANDTVYLLFPNQVEEFNRLSAGVARTIPGLGYSFRAELPKNKRIGVESIIAVAMRDSLQFLEKRKMKSAGGYFQMWRTGMNEVLKWISGIEADRRTEAIKSVTITR